MNIPQKADKWVVFGLSLALAIFYYPRGPAIPSQPMFFTLFVSVIAMLGTICYLGWCALCRLFVRFWSRGVTPMRVRLVANSLFAIGVTLAVFWPGKGEYVFAVKDVKGNTPRAINNGQHISHTENR
jgi:hypothetical protein